MNNSEIREAPGIYGATRVDPQFGGSAAPVLTVEGQFGDPVKASCSKRIRPVGHLRIIRVFGDDGDAQAARRKWGRTGRRALRIYCNRLR